MADALVPFLELAPLNSWTRFTLLKISGIDFISLGDASTSQKQYLDFLFKNSLDPMKGCINLAVLLSFLIIKSFSSLEINKLPWSVGLLPLLK